MCREHELGIHAYRLHLAHRTHSTHCTSHVYIVTDLITCEIHTFTTYNVAWAFAQTLDSYDMTFTITPQP